MVIEIRNLPGGCRVLGTLLSIVTASANTRTLLAGEKRTLQQTGPVPNPPWQVRHSPGQQTSSNTSIISTRPEIEVARGWSSLCAVNWPPLARIGTLKSGRFPVESRR